jgi:hypothetical protein
MLATKAITITAIPSNLDAYSPVEIRLTWEVIHLLTYLEAVNKQWKQIAS